MLKLLTFPNEKLTRPSDPILVNDTSRNLALAMKAELMLYGGLGLAAPQVGFNLRLILVKVADGLYETMFNPTFTSSGKIITSRESCLSLPGEWWAVPRYTEVSVTYTMANGELTNRVFSEKDIFQYPVFVIVQHEIDHLNGILINMIGRPTK